MASESSKKDLDYKALAAPSQLTSFDPISPTSGSRGEGFSLGKIFRTLVSGPEDTGELFSSEILGKAANPCLCELRKAFGDFANKQPQVDTSCMKGNLAKKAFLFWTLVYSVDEKLNAKRFGGDGSGDRAASRLQRMILACT